MLKFVPYLIWVCYNFNYEPKMFCLLALCFISGVAIVNGFISKICYFYFIHDALNEAEIYTSSKHIILHLDFNELHCIIFPVVLLRSIGR